MKVDVMPNSDEIRNWATAYAALIATLSFSWNLFLYWKDRPHFTVAVSNPTIRWTEDSPKISVASLYTITVISKGRDPITLEACGVQFEEGRFSVPDATLPKELRRHQKHIIDLHATKSEAKKVLYAWARDSTGKEWHSKKRPLRR